jgi:hypothetical protein
MILPSDLSHNDDHHPRTSIVNPRRRRAKCGLIRVFSGSGRNSFRLPPILSSMPAMRKVNSYRLPTLFFFHLASLPHEANDSSMLSVAEVRPLSKGMVNFRDNEKGTFATCYSWSGHNVIPPERWNRCQHTPVREPGLHSHRSVVHRLFRKDDLKSPSCPVITIRPCYLTMPAA